MDKDTLDMLNTVSDFLSNMVEKVIENELYVEGEEKKAFIFNTKGEILAECKIETDFKFKTFLDQVLSSGILLSDVDIRRSISSVNRYSEYNIKTILVVDDEQDLLSILSNLLENAGHYFECYQDPEKALERVYKNGALFDVAVLDWWMPKMTGSVVGEKLSKVNPIAQIIYYTGNARAIPIQTQISARVLNKPANLEELFLPAKRVA